MVHCLKQEGLPGPSARIRALQRRQVGKPDAVEVLEGNSWAGDVDGEYGGVEDFVDEALAAGIERVPLSRDEAVVQAHYLVDEVALQEGLFDLLDADNLVHAAERLVVSQNTA